jgi:hypothetical protein
LSFDTEIQYNWNDRKWFVPFDMTLGKGFHDFLISMDYKVGIVRDFPVFKHDIELACSYVF